MGANVYVIFKNGEPIDAVVGDSMRDPVRRAGGENWAPAEVDSALTHLVHPGGGEIRQVWPPESSPRRAGADVYARRPDSAHWATRGGRAVDIPPPRRPFDEIVRTVDASLRRPPPVTRADLDAALKKAAALRTTTPLPVITTDRPETFNRFVRISGMDLRPVSGAPDAPPSLFGVPVRTDPSMLPGTIRIGDRLLVLNDHDVVLEIDTSKLDFWGDAEQDIAADIRNVLRKATPTTTEPG